VIRGECHVLANRCRRGGSSMLGVLNKSPGTSPGFLPGTYKVQVVLTVKYRIPDNLLLPGNVPGAKMDPGILPGLTTMHSGTTIDHLLATS